jgi:hypothetical protein
VQRERMREEQRGEKGTNVSIRGIAKPICITSRMRLNLASRKESGPNMTFCLNNVTLTGLA